MATKSAVLLAGIPAENPALFHRVRFGVGDPAAWISIHDDERHASHFIVRDIERDRARQKVAVDNIHCPADFEPEGGLSGDRTTATAQAVAECLRRQEVTNVVTDRTLPFVYAWHIQQAGIAVDYSPELGVSERRSKDEQELQWLADAQRVTEEAMAVALQGIARADVDASGTLKAGGQDLTSEMMQQSIESFLLMRGYSSPHGCIVASLPHSADCHARGAGPLKTGQAVIVDIFPQCKETHYYGDCTRTVVNGDPSDEIVKMHAAVVEAKAAATAKTIAGATADEVHTATKEAITKSGYRFARGEISDDPVMPHGTGHGVGLEVHEPILLDDNGGTLMLNEVLTIEPGLYSRKFGGVRVEDMVVTTDATARSLNALPEGLNWR